MSSSPETINEIIRVGSRKSELALVQTKFVIACLQKWFPKQTFEIHTMTTMGDRVLNISLPKIGEKSLFTKDLEDALQSGRIDFVVHSLKDLPTCLPDGMAIGAILEREDARDALILNKKHEGKSLETLPEGSIIGTSSLRRTSQLYRKYPHLVVHDIRGNLNTRLAKLDAENSKFAGIILAQAGIQRMGWHDRISQTLNPDEVLYAVGQGALAVECRANDEQILQMLSKLSCLQTQCRILAERSFLKTLGGGCSAPVAVETILLKAENIDEVPSGQYKLEIKGGVWSLDGQTEIVGVEKCCLNLTCAKKRTANLNDDDVVCNKIPRSNGDQQISPPKIIAYHANETESSDSDELAKLVQLHEDAFKKCPYSSILSNALSIPLPTSPELITESSGKSEIENHSVSQLKCPMDFPVGQDVMGQCPFFDGVDQQKLKESTMIQDKCSHDATEILECPFSSLNVKPTTQVKCPFSNRKTSENTTVVSGQSETIAAQSKCPYLAKSVSNGESTTNLKESKQQLEGNAVQLFCGLYRHLCYPLDIFNTCEAVGRRLAEQLITDGAHKIMEVAQREIRQTATAK